MRRFILELLVTIIIWTVMGIVSVISALLLGGLIGFVWGLLR